MKRPTPAAWRRLFGQYEEVFNSFLPYLTDDERDKLFAAHDVLRTRASGADTEQRRND